MSIAKQGLEYYDEVSEFTPEQQRYLIEKYKTPSKVDKIMTAVDYGNPRFDDRSCSTIMAKLQDGRYFVLESKLI